MHHKNVDPKTSNTFSFLSREKTRSFEKYTVLSRVVMLVSKQIKKWSLKEESHSFRKNSKRSFD